MSPWEGIQEFITVVEMASFTAAAKRLRVSSAHVSRQVARLEDRINVKLLSRSTRVVRLTDAGSEYYRKVSSLAVGIEEANQAAAGAHAQLMGRIRVSAAGTFSEEHIAPALAQFATENPQVNIEIDFSTRFVDLVDQGFDFAVRYGVLPDSGLIARRLVGRTMVCAASPDYLKQHGEPSTPGELQHHNCLTMNSDRWVFNSPDGKELIEVLVSGSWRANNGRAVQWAAIEGLGIIYAPIENLQAGLQAGLLKPILKGFEDKNRASWIIYPEKRHLPLRVRKAMDYLINSFQENPL